MEQFGLYAQSWPRAEIDKAQGLTYYLEAAYRGMSMGMNNAAQAYHRANGVAQADWALAAKWYRLCVQTYPRYASAWNNLGIILRTRIWPWLGEKHTRSFRVLHSSRSIG